MVLPMNGKLLVISAILALSCLPLHAEELTIAVASNFARPMNALVAEFEEGTGHHLNVSYGSSGRLYAQIINGAPFHLFFSADQEKSDALEQSGQAVKGSRFTYATGALVLWSANPELELAEGQALRNLQVKRLAIANPRLAPYGMAAMQVLQVMELDSDYKERLVRGENINQAFQFVNSGNAQAGFMALSQVLDNGSIQQGAGWIIPANLYDPIRQDAVLLKNGNNNQAAQEFLDFMRSQEAQSIIASYGYSTD
jgi:molybdate transport system substrate-binding protein